jgi:hypothetical protein
MAARRVLAFCMCSLAATLAALARADEPTAQPMDPAVEHFEKHVRPLLAATDKNRRPGGGSRGRGPAPPAAIRVRPLYQAIPTTAR